MLLCNTHFLVESNRMAQWFNTVHAYGRLTEYTTDALAKDYDLIEMGVDDEVLPATGLLVRSLTAADTCNESPNVRNSAN